MGEKTNLNKNPATLFFNLDLTSQAFSSILCVSSPWQHRDNSASCCFKSTLWNKACQMVLLQKAKFCTVSTSWLLSAGFFSGKTNQDPMKDQWRVSWVPEMTNNFSSHPFIHFVSKIWKGLDDGSKNCKQYWLLYQSQRKEGKQNFVFVISQILGPLLQWLYFFPPFSRCWRGKIDHAFFQGLAFSF